MVLHLGKSIQMPQAQTPVQQTAKADDSKLKELEEQNKNLENINYFNGLSDEKTFRFELLQAINRIAVVLNGLNEKIIELTSQETQEEQ